MGRAYPLHVPVVLLSLTCEVVGAGPQADGDSRVHEGHDAKRQEEEGHHQKHLQGKSEVKRLPFEAFSIDARIHVLHVLFFFLCQPTLLFQRLFIWEYMLHHLVPDGCIHELGHKRMAVTVQL